MIATAATLFWAQQTSNNQETLFNVSNILLLLQKPTNIILKGLVDHKRCDKAKALSLTNIYVQMNDTTNNKPKLHLGELVGSFVRVEIVLYIDFSF